jgi:hypothetical protein
MCYPLLSKRSSPSANDKRHVNYTRNIYMNKQGKKYTSEAEAT